MSNPKVRSLGRRGGQPASGENEEAKKKGSYSYQVDDETKDIVKSLFEEYASDDGKNFYSGNRDEKSEQEHEEFLNEVDEQLSQDSEPEEDELPEAEEEKPVKILGRKAKPGKKLFASKEKAEEEAAASSEKTDDSETAAEEETVKSKENKKTGILKSPKKTETSETEASATAGEKPAEEKTAETQTGKTEKNKTKTKGKAEKKMKKRSTPNNDEIYDEYDDGYDEYDDYEDEYDDDYDDYDDDDFEDDDEDFVEPKRSKRSKSGGGGVEFSLKIVSLTIILVIVLLIMTALFINNRSLSKELQEANTKYDNLVEQYSSDIDQLNAKLAEFTNPQSGETAEPADTSSDTNSDSSESSDSDSDSSSDGEENYYIVQSGDTLSKIAGKELGDSSLYYLIQEANNMSGTALTVGDKLIIPDVEE